MRPLILTLVLQFSFMIRSARAGNSSRLVVTFLSPEDNSVYGVDLGGASVIKQYGRRLVLDVGVPFDLEEQTQIAMARFPRVQCVEEDLLVGVEEDLDDLGLSFEVYDSLIVSNASDTALGGVSPPVNASDPAGESTYISPMSQTPLWNLLDAELYSVHAEGVWQVTNSTPETVVAVLDSGIAAPARQAFINLLNGYDFVSDEAISIDLDGRDPDATDPGDWGDTCSTPSWHGTKVASILAARHDNDFGMKGVAQNCSILPLRVLGLCRTGYASDVADAVVWAAGGAIDGVPTNLNPARIISLSLAGRGKCPNYLQSAVSQALELGAVVIAAAGNSNQNVSGYFPANCKGVAAIAASTREGKLAWYSNWGRLITFMAPGGDWRNAIMTLGIDEQETGLEIFYGMGTSFAVPHVSGVFALFMGLSFKLNTSQGAEETVILTSVNADCVMGGCKSPIISSRGIHQWVKMPNLTFMDVLPYISSDLTLEGTYTYIFNGIVYTYIFYGGQVATPGKRCSSYEYWTLQPVNTFGFNCFVTNFCSPGTFTGGSNELHCTVCPVGTYSESGASACTLCGVGSFQTGSGIPSSLGCTACQAGSFSTVLGATLAQTCTLCGTGKFSTSLAAQSSQVCALCGAGSYQTGSGIPSSLGCTACQAGSFSTVLGATLAQTCTLCGTGKFSTSLAAQSSQVCALCSAGSYQTGSGIPSSLGCTACQAGSFSTVLGATLAQTCTLCGTGKFSTSLAAQSSQVCALCGAGSYQTGSGIPSSLECTACQAGSYSTALGATLSQACTLCGPGKYSLTPGAQSSQACTSCAAGAYQTGSGFATALACLSCPAGTFSLAIASACTACATGTFAALPGASQCTACTPISCAQSVVIPCTSTSDQSCGQSCVYPDNARQSSGSQQCPWMCNPGYKINSDGTGCYPCFNSATCPVGFYRTTCSDGINDGACVACNNAPPNAVYTSYAISPVGVSDCPFVCQSGFTPRRSDKTCSFDPFSTFCCAVCGVGKFNTGCSALSSGTCAGCYNS